VVNLWIYKIFLPIEVFISFTLLQADWQAAEKASECFEYLSMNEIFSIISKLSPFVTSINSVQDLSPSKDDRRVFQQPAKLN